MTAVLSGTNGLLQSYDYQVPTTGFSYTFAAGTQVLVMNPAGTLATGTITMPAAPVDGMTITFSSSQQITALTMAGNGASIVGAVTFLPAKTGVTYVYRATGTTWYPTVTVPGTGSQLVQGTSVASTSGTSIDFTGIPSWAKRITVMFFGTSTNGTSNILLQIGSGTVQTTGYVGKATNAFVAYLTPLAASTLGGNAVLTNQSGNNWCCSISLTQSDGNATNGQSGGNVTLSGALTIIRITSVTPDTFDAGSINILYE